MPIYEYRCDECHETFELRRDVSESSAPAHCAEGHLARRKLSVFATVASSAGEASYDAPVAACGPDCACAAGF